MEQSSRELAIARLLAVLEDDWAPACVLASFVQHSGVATPSGNREACLSIIEEMLANDLVRVGQLSPAFTPWDLSVPDLIRQLTADWPADKVIRLGDDPCWFDITDAGRRWLQQCKCKFAAELDRPYKRTSVRKP